MRCAAYSIALFLVASACGGSLASQVEALEGVKDAQRPASTVTSSPYTQQFQFRPQLPQLKRLHRLPRLLGKGSEDQCPLEKSFETYVVVSSK